MFELLNGDDESPVNLSGYEASIRVSWTPNCSENEIRIPFSNLAIDEPEGKISGELTGEQTKKLPLKGTSTLYLVLVEPSGCQKTGEVGEVKALP